MDLTFELRWLLLESQSLTQGNSMHCADVSPATQQALPWLNKHRAHLCLLLPFPCFLPVAPTLTSHFLQHLPTTTYPLNSQPKSVFHTLFHSPTSARGISVRVRRVLTQPWRMTSSPYKSVLYLCVHVMVKTKVASVTVTGGCWGWRVHMCHTQSCSTLLN